MTIKSVMRLLLAFTMVLAGSLHFAIPDPYVAIMPAFLPWHLELVYISGVFEILGGLGLLLPRTRRAAAWGLILLYVAVFPANVNMAVNEIQAASFHIDPVWMWLRLPLQLLFIAWAYWMTRPDPVSAPG